MLYSVKIKSLKFTGVSKQEAYLKGCKKLAKFIVNPENVTVKIDNDPEDNNSIIFTLFASIALNSEISDYCKMCKEFHCSFYVNEEYNCNTCNLKNCMNRTKQKASITKLYYKHKFEKE